MGDRLKAKVAVITGAGSGMGAETARRFAEEGAKVLVTDMNDERGESVAAELGEAGAFLHVDVTIESQVAAAVEAAVSRWGHIDIMYNNAGFGGARGPITSTSEADFDITSDVLFKGPFFGMKHAGAQMVEQGSGGSIISTASVAGLLAGETPHLYSANKAALIHLTKSVALELGEHGIRVNVICPGVITTPLAIGRRKIDDAMLEKFRSRLGRNQVIGRVGEPSDIANAALWLASDESSFVTGTTQVVDGGAFAGRAWRRQHPISTQARPIKLYRPEGR